MNKIIIKIIVSIILGIYLSIGNIWYWNYSNFENSLDLVVKKIITKQITINWIYWTYTNILLFNNQLQTINNPQNIKLQSLKLVIKNELHIYEWKYFIDNNTLYVNDLNDPYIYLNWNKINIYENESMSDLKEFNICDINNKTKCVKYNNTLFSSDLYVKQLKLPLINDSLISNNTWIYKQKIISYYPETENFILWKKSLSFYLKDLNINNLNYLFGNEYIPINNLWIYSDKTHKSYLWVYKKDKISDLDITQFKNINKKALLEVINLDLRYMKFLNKDDILNIQKEALKLNSLQDIYKYIKWKVSYDTDVYKEYLKTNTVSTKKYYVFTWIWANKESKAVCSWYSWYLEYMLAFKNYSNIEKQEWYYIDFDTWNLIPHARLKQWDKYYDITFDDWLSGGSKHINNLYYWLPKDIIMINRVLDSDKKKYDMLLNMSIDERKSYLLNQYFLIAQNKKYDNIKLLDPYRKLLWYWMNSLDKFNLNFLWKQMKNKYYFNIKNDWTLGYFKDIKWKDINIKEVELIRLKTIKDLIYALQINNVNNINLWTNEQNQVFLLLNIKNN